MACGLKTMFLTRSHHEDIIREKNLQIGYRDHRIAELEAERKLLWDKLCLLEIGEAIFDVAPAQKLNAGATTCHPEPSAICEVKDLNSPSSDAATNGHPEPGPCGTAALGGESQSTKSNPDVSVRLGRPRPSQIMRSMDRLMHNRWLQKLRPAKSAETKRDQVMEQLNAAHADAVKTATTKIDAC